MLYNVYDKIDEYSNGDPYDIDLKRSFHRRRVNCIVELIKQTGKKNPKIIDIGCGKGIITNEIKKKIPVSGITAIDNSLGAIEYARKEFGNIKFDLKDARKISGSYDIAILSNVIEHIPDPINVLKGINRILTENGYLIISTPSRYRLSNIIRKIFGLPVKMMNQYHITEYSTGQIIEHLNYSGFEVLRAYSRPILVRKKRIIGLIYSFGVLVLSLLSNHIWESTAFYLARKK